MPFQCDECNSTFSLRQTLNRHIRSKHQLSEEFQCEHCEYKCNRKDNLARHFVKAHVTPKKENLTLNPKHMSHEKKYMKIQSSIRPMMKWDDEMDFDDVELDIFF